MGGFQGLMIQMVALLCAVWIPVGLGQSGSQVVYTRIDELPGHVVIGNVIRDANLDTLYQPQVLDTFVLEIIGGQHMEYFHMDPDNVGNLKTTKFLDRDFVCQNEEECDISLDVAIVRPTDYFQIIQVTLTLLDNNDNRPEFIEPSATIRISENALPFVSFVLPTATDPDSPIYSIQAYSFTRKSSKFDLELSTNGDGSQDLRLKLLKRLNREEQSSYSLQVECRDGGLPPKVGLLDIQVIVVDANDHTPIFQRSTYNVSVREDHPAGPGSPFLQVMATDEDEGLNSQIIYSLAPQALDTFHIDSHSGELSLVKQLDYETQTTYNLLVTARDLGPDSVPVHVRVGVNVEDVNDFVPTIAVSAWTESGQIEVMENEVRAFVAHVSVTDDDLGISGQVTCKLSDDRFQLEPMYTNKYKIETLTMMNREADESVIVGIVCSDHGSPSLSASTEFIVYIMDENDHEPVFNREVYSVSIAETSAIGQSVLTVRATDDDIGDNAHITYHLHANSKNLLRVDSNSGLVTTNSLLDHETLSQLNFYVLAIDGGQPAFTATTTVSMTITDVNDESPVFGQAAYNFGSYENQLPGTEIGTVSATDNDAPPNNEFLFSLSDNSTFSIEPRTGIIKSNKVLDREHKGAYYLYILARDTQPPHLSSTVSLTIYVADRNDNAPRIFFPRDDNNTVEISGYISPGYAITKILATDADLGNNARLEYVVGKGNIDGMFNLDPLSGLVTLQGDISTTEKESYEMLIIVKDHGQSELDGEKSAMATLNIVVNRTEQFAAASNIIPRVAKSPSSMLGYHEMILIIIGAVTLVVVAILILAIVCIKRRQRRQERDSYKYVTRVDVVNVMKGSDGHIQEKVPMENLPPSTLPHTQPESARPYVDLPASTSLPYIDESGHQTYKTPIIYPSALTQDLPPYPADSCPLHGHSSDGYHDNTPDSIHSNTLNGHPSNKPALATFQSPVPHHHGNKMSGCKRDGQDSDSTSGCSADSGHGPSEEGENRCHTKMKDADSLSHRLPHHPNLPPRTSSLGRPHKQTGCHGYQNGSNDSINQNKKKVAFSPGKPPRAPCPEPRNTAPRPLYTLDRPSDITGMAVNV